MTDVTYDVLERQHSVFVNVALSESLVRCRHNVGHNAAAGPARVSYITRHGRVAASYNERSSRWNPLIYDC